MVDICDHKRENHIRKVRILSPSPSPSPTPQKAINILKAESEYTYEIYIMYLHKLN